MGDQVDSHLVCADEWDDDSPIPQIKVIENHQIPNKAYIKEVAKRLAKRLEEKQQ